MFIFPKNENKNEVKKICFIFWARQGLTLLLHISIHNGKSGIM